MREIKFRVWATGEGRYRKGMFDWEAIKESFTDESGWHKSIFHLGIDYPNNTILMQFTGLRDKNGKDIYEGDIVKSGNYEKRIMDVEYTNCGFSPFAEAYFGDEIFDSEKCEIIGNIYENSELLESKP